MIIEGDLIRGSVSRWRKTARTTPDALAQRVGEGNRDSATSRQRQTRLNALMSQARDPLVARTQLERIIAGNDLTGINYLAIGSLRAQSVCRVNLRDATGRTVGFGTGFLVAPGIVMTNHHVIAGV